MVFYWFSMVLENLRMCFFTHFSWGFFYSGQKKCFVLWALGCLGSFQENHLILFPLILSERLPKTSILKATDYH